MWHSGEQAQLRFAYLQEHITKLQEEITGKRRFLIQEERNWQFWCHMQYETNEAELQRLATGKRRASAAVQRPSEMPPANADMEFFDEEMANAAGSRDSFFGYANLSARAATPRASVSRPVSRASISGRRQSINSAASSRPTSRQSSVASLSRMRKRRSFETALGITSFEKNPWDEAVNIRKAVVNDMIVMLETQLTAAIDALKKTEIQLDYHVNPEHVPVGHVPRHHARSAKKATAATAAVSEAQSVSEVDAKHQELEMQMDGLRGELRQLQPQLRAVAAIKQELMTELTKGFEMMQDQLTVVRQYHAIVQDKQKVVDTVKKDLKQAMDVALPSFAMALMSVKRLRPQHIEETMSAHCGGLDAVVPDGVRLVVEALCILFDKPGVKKRGNTPGTYCRM